MCSLHVVLFASGKGADAASYRPNRDDSQWWNRRDALVRCVTAFLFGPGATPRRALTIIFDEDWSCMHMKYDDEKGSFLPIEKNVILLWKRAASSKVGEAVTENGLSCEIRRFGVNQKGALPSGMDSKRDILQHLQEICSIQFLREHRLNSSPEVILRKANKKALIEIWNKWREKESVHTTRKSSGSSKPLESILRSLLQPSSETIKKLIAATLHESSEAELPCWKQPATHDDDELHLVLFLGAVRDMNSSELQCLNQVSFSTKTPLVQVRMGPVPEFTSKILSIVAMHHAKGLLGTAMRNMLENNARTRKRPLPTLAKELTSSAELHFICCLPIDANQFSIQLDARNRIMWNVVRCVVNALWRSRLVGNSSPTILTNKLSLVFNDGSCLSLDQEELTQHLAEQHQAAPSEYQILRAIHEKLPEISKAVTLLVDVIGSKQAVQVPDAVLNFDMTDNVCSSSFGMDYNMFEEHMHISGSLVAFFDIPPENNSGQSDTIKKSLLKALKKKKIRVKQASFNPGLCADNLAASIALLQHLCYQNRLFGNVNKS